MSDRMMELEQKFKHRNLLQELAYYANYPPKGYVRKEEVDLIRWAMYKAYQIIKGRPTMSSCDCISRKAIRDRLHRIIEVNKLRPDIAWFTPNGVEALIDEIPPTAVQPVVRGEWIMRNNACVCSNCGNPVAFKLMSDGCHVGDFCTKCGADMRPEQADREADHAR